MKKISYALLAVSLFAVNTQTQQQKSCSRKTTAKKPAFNAIAELDKLLAFFKTPHVAPTRKTTPEVDTYNPEYHDAYEIYNEAFLMMHLTVSQVKFLLETTQKNTPDYDNLLKLAYTLIQTSSALSISFINNLKDLNPQNKKILTAHIQSAVDIATQALKQSKQ